MTNFSQLLKSSMQLVKDINLQVAIALRRKKATQRIYFQVPMVQLLAIRERKQF